MRIHSIEAIPVSYPEPNDFNALRHLSTWGKQTFPPRAPFPSVRRAFARGGSAGRSPATPDEG
jgi:hypothetical protein